MATLDELVVRIKADASQLERELKRMQGVTKQTTDQMGGSFGLLKKELLSLAPPLAAATFVAFGKRAIDAAGRMNDLAGQIGFAASTISALESPLAATGTSLDQFAASINLMNGNIGQAVSGNEELAMAFSRLGLSVDDLSRMSPEEQFYVIADALSQVGTQYEQTELGRKVFGRGFATLLPLIKEANGALGQTVQALKNTGDALSEDTLKRIDDFGDALSRAAIQAKNEFLASFAVMLQVAEFASRWAPSAEESTSARMSNYGIGTGVGTSYSPAVEAQAKAARQREIDAYAAKARAGGFVATPTVLGAEQFGPNRAVNYNSVFGPNQQSKSGAAVRSTARDTRELSDATQSLIDRMDRAKQITEQSLTPQERHNQNVAEARTLYNEGLITLETYSRVQDDMKDGMGDVGDQAVISAKLIKDSFGDALESAMFDFESFGSAAGGILEGIARNIARQKLIEPLTSGLSGILDGIFSGNSLSQSFGFATAGGYGPFQAFADGGRPPVGVPSIVGERGPELFIPDTAGTIIPNRASVGGGMNFTQIINVSPGVPELIRSEINRAAPGIAAAAQAGIIQSAERGGRTSQILGKRN